MDAEALGVSYSKAMDNGTGEADTAWDEPGIGPGPSAIEPLVWVCEGCIILSLASAIVAGGGSPAHDLAQATLSEAA